MARRKEQKPEGRIIIFTSDPVLVDWGERIANHRKLLGLSQQELAERVGVSYPTVWRWENGKIEPRRHHKVALAQELSSDVRVLFPMTGAA